MMIRVMAFIRMLRPHQWVKNVFVFAPGFFSKHFFEASTLLPGILCFAAFCFAASAVYTLNDIADREADRAHPIKKNRPIASGLVSMPEAVALLVGLLVLAFLFAWRLPIVVLYCLLAYLLLNVGYSFFLKHVAYIDAFCIAFGFELRVLAGAAAVQVQASTYLLMVTVLLALFLAFGKRAHELSQGETAFDRRAVLKNYSPQVVTILLYVAALCTIGVYYAYTLDHSTADFFGTHFLPWTTIFVAVGVLRFAWLIVKGTSAESPTERMLSDPPFLINIFVWLIAVLILIYIR